MAKNAKYYAKISGNWEQQNFETTATQVSFTDQGTGILNGKTTVEAALERIHDMFGVNSGFATLNALGKIQTDQLPSSITGGMRFVGALTTAQTYTFDNITSGTVGTAGKLTQVGEYLIAAEAVVLSNSGSTVQGSLQNSVGDDGTVSGDTVNNSIGSDGLSLEKGDWIVCTAIDVSSNTVTIAIINNTYQDADSDSKGIVTLSSYADGDGFNTLSGNGVITESTLKLAIEDNFGGGATNFAAGNHHHDGTYLEFSGGQLTGNLTLGNGASSDADIIFNSTDNSAADGARSNKITFKYKPASLSLDSKDLDVAINGGLEFDGELIATADNWNRETSYAGGGIGIPEIFVNTAAPGSSTGKNGDVYIEYTA